MTLRAQTPHLQKDPADMVTTDLGACEWFVWDLRRSNLIDRGQLDQVIGEFLNRHPGAEPPALAEYLVGQGTLTQFQADRLLQGKTQGFVLGPFTLMDALGTGSMGTVYKAQSKNDNQWYAVKVLPRRSMWNVRIARRKVRDFEQCQHPSVVPFVDVGTSGGMHYLAWPLVEGASLDKIVEREGKLTPAMAAMYVLQAAEGLAVCHKRGLFHGLIKPSNLMVGGDGQMRILDFGIGSLLAETEGESLVDTMSTANSVSSGLDCSSPESIMDPSNLTPLGDQYSLGCVLYYCLTGSYPFPDGTAVEKMMAHQTKQPMSVKQRNPEIPDELAAVVERLMQKAPEARFANIGELMEALRRWAAPMPQASRQIPKLPSGGAREPRGEKLSAAVPVLSETPRPAKSMAAPLPRPSTITALPTRQSINKAAAAAQAAPARSTAAAKPVAVPAVSEARPPVPASRPIAPEPPVDKASFEERLGPVGVVVLACVACALAWLVTNYFLKF
ncbi:MAG: serine/threonine protein kinase [Gemmataceae bacterium]